MNFKKTITPRARVDPEYTAAVNRIYKEGIRTARSRMSQTDRMMFEFLRSISKDEEAREREQVRLRSLPFERFSAAKDSGVEYLVGLTRPVEVTKNCGQKYYPGPYYVFIPASAIIDVSPQMVHLIPKLNPKTTHRHPHHFAGIPPGENNPLRFSPNTCLGSFRGMLPGLYSLLDITGIWQAWHLYLSRWDEGSQYCHGPELERVMNGGKYAD